MMYIGVSEPKIGGNGKSVRDEQDDEFERH